MPARLLTRPFVFAFASMLLMGITFALFVHYAGFLAELGADEVTIGLIVGVGSIGSLIVRPNVGYLMDRIGRRPLIHLGNAVNVVSLGLLTTVESLSWWVYTLTVVHGVAEAILFTALMTYGADVVPATRRTEGLALFGVAGQLPIALGGLAGDFILRRGDFDDLFWVAAVVGLFALLAGLPLPETRRSDLEPAKGFFYAIRQRGLSPLWLVSAAFSLALISYFTFLKTYVESRGFGSVGTFFALYSITAIALRVGGSRVPARFGEQRVLVISLLTLAGGTFLLAFADGSAAVNLAGVACGAGHGYSFPILYSLVVTRSSETERGAALSGFLSFFPLAGLLGGPALGAVIRSAGYTVMYAAIGTLTVVVVAIYAVWTIRRPVRV